MAAASGDSVKGPAEVIQSVEYDGKTYARQGDDVVLDKKNADTSRLTGGGGGDPTNRSKIGDCSIGLYFLA